MTTTALVKSGGDIVQAETGIVVHDMGSYISRLSGNAAIEEQRRLSAAYDTACAALIGPNDVQVEGGRTFKKKSAWRKLARHFGISTSVVTVGKEDFEGVFIATVTVRASAPWGQSAESVGACGTDEATGRRHISIADAIATAETRATNRAVSNLVAMGEVSAEEMSKGEARPTPAGASNTAQPASAPTASRALDEESCPKCGGRMWDNRKDKKNPRAPDFKCRDRSCDGVIWPAKAGEKAESVPVSNFDDFPKALQDDDDDLPF